jgi:MGT family glycosyltransferase
MARIAFFSVPAYGHVNPTLPVVAELVRRGESVTYYSEEEFREQVRRTGATFRAYHPPVDHDAAEAASNPFHLAAVLLESAMALLPDLLQDLERDGVDYVIYDSVCPWGRFAAEILRLPSVSSHTVFAVSKELFLPPNPLAKTWRVFSMLLGNLPSLRRIRRGRRHLESVYGVASTQLFDVLSNRAPLNLVYTSRTFQPRPELFDSSYEFVGPSLAPRGDEGGFGPELEGEPVIYVSLGTIFNQAGEFYRCAFEALGGMGRRVILSVGKRTDIAQLGAIPANFTVREFVPQLLVLSRAALFLTRGGMNSVNESLYYGVPMLLFPEILEQKLVARQVVDSGAGVALDAAKIRPDDLRAKVDKVLAEPKFREAAQRVGASLREAGGYVRAADRIVAYRDSRLARPDPQAGRKLPQ